MINEQSHDCRGELIECVDTEVSDQKHTSMKSIEDIVLNRLDDIRDELADMTEYRKKLLAERKELNNVKKAL